VVIRVQVTNFAEAFIRSGITRPTNAKKPQGSSRGHNFLVVLVSSLVLAGCAQTGALDGKAKSAFEEYQAASWFQPYKAFSVGDDLKAYGRSWQYPTAKGAIKTATNECEKHNSWCELYALGNTIVYGMTTRELEDFIRSHNERISGNSPSSDFSSIGAAGRLLNKEEIKERLTGFYYVGRSNNNLDVEADFYSDGRLRVKLDGPKMKKSGKRPMTGRWWLKEDRLCFQVPGIYAGKVECRDVFAKDKEIRLVSDAGEIISKFQAAGSARE